MAQQPTPKPDLEAKLAKSVAVMNAPIAGNKDGRSPLQMLELPVTQLMHFKNISMPGKVFLVIFLIMFVVELIAEAYIFFKNKDTFSANNMTMGFWVRYILGAIFAVIVFVLYMIVIHVLFYSGYKLFVWFMVFVPLLYFVGTMISARFIASLMSTYKGEAAKGWLTSLFVPKEPAAPSSQ